MEGIFKNMKKKKFKIAPPRILIKEKIRQGIQSGKIEWGSIDLYYSLQQVELDETFLREFWDFLHGPFIFYHQKTSKDFQREFKNEQFRENETKTF